MKRNRTQHLGGTILSAVACFWCLTSTAGGWDVVLPRTNVRPISGLTVKLDPSGVVSSGNQVVRVFVGPLTGRMKTERAITITLTSPGLFYPRRRIVASRSIVIPKGSTGVVRRMLIPFSRSWRSYDVRVEDSSGILTDLSENDVMSSRRYRGLDVKTCNMLIIDADAPTRDEQASTRALDKRFGRLGSPAARKSHKLPDIRLFAAPVAAQASENYAWYYQYVTSLPLPRPVVSDRGIVQSIRSAFELELWPFADLPDQWVYLSPFDLIVISWDDLNALRSTQPQRWHALRDWVAAGGTLILYGTGVDPRQLAAIDQVLGSVSAADYFRRGPVWRHHHAAKGRPELRGRELLESPNSRVQRANNPTSALQGSKPAGGTSPQPLIFCTRALEFGTVVALSPRNPFPGRIQDWVGMFNTLGRGRWFWEIRHGNSLDNYNSDTWGLLIPGVGTPPVGLFVALISVFIVLVGPVNYLLLRRWKRLYLLLFTVPSGAAMVVLGTFAYAVVADGLGVKLRVRSLTLLDQRAEQQVSWSWQTYYASLVPSAGLVFPRDATVYPLLSEMTGINATTGDYRTFWQGHSQSFTGAYLRPRIPAFFSVIQPARSTLGLKISGARNADEPMHVVNALDTSVQQVLLVGANGQLYYVENLPAGARVDAQPAELAASAQRLQDTFITNHMRVPKGVLAGNAGAGGFGRPYYLGRSVGWDTSTSLVERQLKWLEQSFDQLPPRHYVAIVDAPRSVPIGVPHATQIGSFHVIFGRW